ncbi:hypothetical protein AYY16_14650 [Morganella psychrotolerans]|nr:hypothetical protein AYY16_14650 [Morganella psychrotolerans]
MANVTRSTPANSVMLQAAAVLIALTNVSAFLLRRNNDTAQICALNLIKNALNENISQGVFFMSFF